LKALLTLEGKAPPSASEFLKRANWSEYPFICKFVNQSQIPTITPIPLALMAQGQIADKWAWSLHSRER
jgi:hypothetical protein